MAERHGGWRGQSRGIVPVGAQGRCEMAHKLAVLVSLCALLLGLLTGCGEALPGSPAAVAEPVPGLESFNLRLPRLHVQYVETGQGYSEPAIWGITASQLGSWLGTDLSMLRIPQFYMDWLKASNVQHIEVAYNGDGLFLYVNGEPMPYIAWDAYSIGATGDLVAGLGVTYGDLIRQLLPLLRHIELGVVLAMPLSDGAQPIPYRDQNAGLMASTAPAEIAGSLGELKLRLVYDEQGMPSVLGMPAALLQPLLGSTPGQLPPATMAQIERADIQFITLQSQGNGLFLLVNGRALPHLAWSQEHLGNAVDLYAQMNEAGTTPNAQFVGLVRQVVLSLDRFDLSIGVEFP
jgi:hypothetical protein